MIHDVPVKTSPLDFILNLIMKSCADIFRPPSARIATIYFNEGVFPDLFKIGQVTLLTKPGTSTDDHRQPVEL